MKAFAFLLHLVNRTLTELRKKFHGTRGKQKIARIDPDQLRTVSQIQKWLARCAGESNSNEANASKQGREMSGEGKTRGGPNAQPTPGSNYPAFSREQLRQKLMDKLDALKSRKDL